MMPALANHLWQSTVFAAAAWLLTLAFRNNRAHVRWWIWLGASIKFLIPFSWLMDIGASLRWAPATQEAAARVVTPAISFAAEQAAQPFVAMPTLTPAVHAGIGLATVLVAVWACGALAVVSMRLRAWRHIRAAVHSSTPLELNLPHGLTARSTSGRMEPGVVGIWRPVLLLPAGILDRLTPEEMSSVLAHECCHVQRHDNFFAALHMVVETLFWFFPPVWWIGARLVEERERACDESVLSQGSESRIYAGAIVSVCRAYLESPVGCVAGVSGADVRRRIATIMTNQIGQRLTRSRRWLLAGAATAALAGPAVTGAVIGLGHAPVLYAQAKASHAGPLPHFTAVSIKPSAPGESPIPWQRDPGYWAARRFTVANVIAHAFGVSPRMVDKIPPWARSTYYDFVAKMPAGTSEAQFRLMLQSMLADRFQMKAHTEMRPMDVSILTTAGTPGPDLHPANRDCVPPPHAIYRSEGLEFGFIKASSSGMELGGCSVSMKTVATYLTMMNSANPVVDESGLKRLYDVDVTIPIPKPFKGESVQSRLHDAEIAFGAAFQKQLGLELDLTKTVKRPMPVLVIDHLARPSAN